MHFQLNNWCTCCTSIHPWITAALVLWKNGRQSWSIHHSDIHYDKLAQLVHLLIIITAALCLHTRWSESTWCAIVDYVIVMIVHQYSQRLANYEWNPDSHVTQVVVPVAEALVNDKCERHLCQHTKKGPDSEHFQGNADKVLMKECWEEEHHYTSPVFWHASSNQRLVEVAQTPPVHWNVPVLPKILHSVCIPPVSVELSVSEAQELSKCVQRWMEEPIECK